MQSWQIVLLIFFVLLPLMLMVDFWGDERLTARGRPIRRAWFRQVRHAAVTEPGHGTDDVTEGGHHADDTAPAEHHH